MTHEHTRPLPRPDAQTRPYWDGCAEGQLHYQSCERCGRTQSIPRALCQHCQSQSLHWHRSRGVGTVLTFTTVHRAPLPAFKAMTPYVIAIVDMDEGFRVMANATAEATARLAIGATVQIGFIEVDSVALPIVQAVLERTAQSIPAPSHGGPASEPQTAP